MSFIPSSDQDCFEWLRLIRCPNVGPILFWDLLRFYGSAQAAFAAIPELSQRGGRRVTPVDEALVNQEWESCKRLGVHLLPAFDPTFPPFLKTLPDCPPILSIFGQSQTLNHRLVGIVGARNASITSCRFAERLARELGEAGWHVVSGLARGIDRAAHQGSLSTGTLAVLAGGIDQIYPPENEALYHHIKEQGAIISEMRLGLFPGAAHFPRRNRLISGLSQGVVVVEAAEKSGSMITARFALDQGRDLFAVPGSPLDPRCRGTNKLLKEGAYLIESAEDVLKVLEGNRMIPYLKEDPLVLPKSLDMGQDVSHLRIRLREDIGFMPILIDEVVRTYGCSQSQLMLALIELELAGFLTRLPNHSVVRSAEEELGSHKHYEDSWPRSI